MSRLHNESAQALQDREVCRPTTAIFKELKMASRFLLVLVLILSIIVGKGLLILWRLLGGTKDEWYGAPHV